MATKGLDITKVGPMSYRQLQSINNGGQTDLSSLIGKDDRFGLDYTPTLYNPVEDAPQEVQSPLGNWGESMWDNGSATEEEFKNLGDIRAKNQWGIAKLGAGISKGAILAGTTFLDGTLGLAYGIGTAASEGRWSGLWDNDFSNALHTINQASEEFLPNYRTEAEQNNPWYKNLGTMNFWADSFLKNMGFTVGALYSGKAWMAPLKMAQELGVAMPALVGEVAGSFLSAVNEGRIEANNNVSDWKALQTTQVYDAYNKAVSELSTDDPMYEANLALLENSRDKQLAEIDDRANAMGNGILLANTILLSYTNFRTFGKLFSGGYKRAVKDFADTEKRRLSDRITREAGKYAFKNFTKAESVASGLQTGLREGLEEMNQAWISETAGNRQSPDSPDAYYNAMINPDSQIQTVNFLDAAAKGFVDTYGDSNRWEEFIVGALTGVIGVPTVGKQANSSANTYLGRGKWIGLSNGLFGDISVNNERNVQGNAAVDIMNKYADRIQDQRDYFIQSQSFINAMDRWSAENNAFEYKNAEDNDDFSAIAAFARVGKLQDLKDLVSQNFENLSDEDLDRIAKYTSKDSDDPSVVDRSGWRDVDGKYLSETEEGRAKMREDLAKNREKTLKNIEDYVNSVELVRAAVNESPDVSDDQINELAWLNWKLNRFRDRFNELKKENSSLFETYLKGLNEYKAILERNIEEEEGYARDDLSRVGNPTVIAYEEQVAEINNMANFLTAMQKTTDPLALAVLMKNKRVQSLVKDIFSEDNFEDFNNLAQGSMQYAQAKNFYENLQDLTKMAKASEQFNARYKEFIEDPLRLVKNREKQEKKVESERLNKVTQQMADDVINSFDEMGHWPEGIDIQEYLANYEKVQSVGGEITPNMVKVAEIAANENGLTTLKDRIERALNRMQAPIQVKADIRALLENVRNDKEPFMFDSALYKDINTIYRENDETIYGKSDDEIKSILRERLTTAEEYMRNVEIELENEQATIDNVANNYVEPDVIEFEDETGNDPAATIPSVNQGVDGVIKVSEDDFSYFKDIFSDTLGDSADDDIRKLIELLHKNQGKSASTILKEGSELYNSSAYNNLVSKLSKNEVDNAITQFLMDKVSNRVDENPSSVNKDTVTQDDVDKAITDENDNSLIGSSKDDAKDYWTPIQSKLPIHLPKKANLPKKAEGRLLNVKFYELVTTRGFKGYSKEQKKYIKALGDYLVKNGTFDRVDSGLVEANTEIHFGTDKELNKDAGVNIILILDSENNVLGSLPTKLDNTFGTYSKLDKFTEYFYDGYEKYLKDESHDETENLWVIPDVTSHLSKWMIGKVVMSDAEANLATIFGTTNSEGNEVMPELTFAVTATDKNGNIRMVKDSSRRQDTAEDLTILKPLKTSNGQPNILIATQNPVGGQRKYVAIPVHMGTFSRNTNLKFTELLTNVLTSIQTLTSQSTPTQIGKAKTALQELVSGKFAINVKNGIVTLSLKKEGKWLRLASTSQNLFVEEAMNAFEANDVPVQMSLKYINKTYNGLNYNDLITPFITVNIESGHPTHTVSNWFTINPIEVDDKGEVKEIPAKSPRSTGKKTPAPKTTVQVFSFTLKGNEYKIDVSTWNKIFYTDSNGQSKFILVNDANKINNNAAKIAAYGYGLSQNLDMTKPYKTRWGNFDPVEMDFVADNTLPNIPDVSNIDLDALGIEGDKPAGLSKEMLDDAASKKGLLSEQLYKDMWDSLDESSKELILDTTDPKQTMNNLSTHWDVDEAKFDFSGSIKDYIDRNKQIFYRRINSETYEVWDKSKELSWLARALPQFTLEDRLVLVSRTIKVLGTPNPERAWGQFKNGIIYISNGAASGTLYHEAFHAVSNTLLSEAEKSQMFSEARNVYGNMDTVALEENIAEDFRRYVQLEERPVIGKLIGIYRKLKHFVLNLFGKESVLDSMFFNISRGNYSKRTIQDTDVTRNRLTTELEQEYDEAEKRLKFLKGINATDTLNAIRDKFLQAKKYLNTNVGQRVNIDNPQKGAEEWIHQHGFDDVLMATTWRGGGYVALKGSMREIQSKVSHKLNEHKKEVELLEQRIPYLREAIANRGEVSRESLEYESTYRDRVRHYIGKYAYENLSLEDKVLLQEKHIPEDVYEKMTTAEKEHLFKCR